jgi:hypothetical protein
VKFAFSKTIVTLAIIAASLFDPAAMGAFYSSPAYSKSHHNAASLDLSRTEALDAVHPWYGSMTRFLKSSARVFRRTHSLPPAKRLMVFGAAALGPAIGQEIPNAPRVAPPPAPPQQTQDAPSQPSGAAKTPPLSREEFYRRLNAFEVSDLPVQLRAARSAVDATLKDLLAHPVPGLGIELNAAMPLSGRHALLFVRLYSLYKLRAPLWWPDALRAEFEALEKVEVETRRQITETNAALFPPLRDVAEIDALTVEELLKARKQFRQTRLRWEEALQSDTPSIDVKKGFTRVWSSVMSWSVLMTIARDEHGTIHIAEVVDKVTGVWTWFFGMHLHRELTHWYVEDHRLRVAHDPVKRTFTTRVHIDIGGAGPEFREFPQVEDDDFPARLAPEDLPPVMHDPGPPPPFGSPGVGGGPRFMAFAA